MSMRRCIHSGRADGKVGYSRRVRREAQCWCHGVGGREQRRLLRRLRLRLGGLGQVLRWGRLSVLQTGPGAKPGAGACKGCGTRGLRGLSWGSFLTGTHFSERSAQVPVSVQARVDSVPILNWILCQPFHSMTSILCVCPSPAAWGQPGPTWKGLRPERRALQRSLLLWNHLLLCVEI